MIRVSKQGQNQKNKCEKEIHSFLDSLCEQKFYGEVIFYFQNGHLEFAKKISRHTKEEIIQSQTKPFLTAGGIK